MTCAMLQQACLLQTRSATIPFLRAATPCMPLKLKDTVCAGGKVYVDALLIARAAPGKHISRPQLDGQ